LLESKGEFSSIPIYLNSQKEAQKISPKELEGKILKEEDIIMNHANFE
jgi:hypothetical protein